METRRDFIKQIGLITIFTPQIIKPVWKVVTPGRFEWVEMIDKSFGPTSGGLVILVRKLRYKVDNLTNEVLRTQCLSQEIIRL